MTQVLAQSTVFETLELYSERQESKREVTISACFQIPDGEVLQFGCRQGMKKDFAEKQLISLSKTISYL